MNDTKKALSCLTLTLSDIGNDTVLCQQVQRGESLEDYENIWTSFAVGLKVNIRRVKYTKYGEWSLVFMLEHRSGWEQIALQERLVKLAPTTVNDTEAQN